MTKTKATAKPLRKGTRIRVGRRILTVISSQRMTTGTVVYRTLEGVAVPASEIA
jgi:hypothetical protein